MRILIIEHESKMGGYLRQGLTENGYAVDLARDGVDGQHLALPPLCPTSCRLQILVFLNREAVMKSTCSDWFRQ